MPEAFWKGVSFGLFTVSVVLAALTASFVRTGLPMPVEALAGAVLGAVFFLAVRVLARLSLRLFARIPGYVLLSLVAAAVLLAVLRWLQFRWPADLYYPAAGVFLLAQAVLVGALWARGSGPHRRWLVALALLTLLVDVLGLVWLLSSGRDPYPLERDTASGPAPEPLALEDPSATGPYRVLERTYGSGTDRRREEFGEGADWTSPTVDVSKFLPEWKGFKARAREWYWGFSLENAPLNGRVWLPEGAGPFPLVLVVHGNHGMEEHSDPGYAYLGELLASRGLVTVSVDENYINATWSGDFRGKEMPLRAILLLEHLKLWRSWNEEPGHPMAGKVDLERIALVGHSRGGEAIAIAAAFNRLGHFPDDASLTFDYGFDIQSLVAIAQTDARYPRRMKLANVSFLALQGSYDSDEASFFGLRQLRRVTLDGQTPDRFKAGILVHGANHGQFNSIWGRTDAGPPYSWLLNLAPLIDGDDQRQIAKVFISAFLEATLKDQRGYVPLFRDPRVGASWLPEVPIVQQFEDGGFEPLASFEEDLDVTTATTSGARIETRNLSKWREEELLYRNDEKQGTSAVVLGWSGEGAEYALTLDSPPSGLDAGASLTFSLGGSTERPTETGSEEGEDAPVLGAPDLSIVVEDASGESAALPLLEMGLGTPPLRVQFLKLARWSRDGFGPVWEPELRRYDVPLERFVAVSPALDLSRITALRLRFDRSPSGVVILDDLGWRRPLPSPPAPVGESQGEAEPEREEREPGNGPAQ